MNQRRKTSIRYEGWYFLLLVMFIIVIAVLRQVNLLFILIGLLLAIFLFNWRLASACLQGLQFLRKLPRRICAGDPLAVDLIVSNNRRHLWSWALLVQDSISLEDEKSKTFQTQVEVLFPLIAVGETGNMSYRALLTRRGRYRFGPMKALSRFPFGLISVSRVINSRDELTVCPRLGHLTPLWTRLLETDHAGNQRSQQRPGMLEGEFYGLREWRNGDSLRWIHWRTSAKLNEPAVRQFEQPRNHGLNIILDLWLDNNAGETELDCVERCISFAATAVADLCRRGGGRLAVTVSGKNGFSQTATASQIYMETIFEQLATVQGDESREFLALLQRAVRESPVLMRTVVVSTRSLDRETLFKGTDSDPYQAAELLNRLTWIDMSDNAWERWFHID